MTREETIKEVAMLMKEENVSMINKWRFETTYNISRVMELLKTDKQMKYEVIETFIWWTVVLGVFVSLMSTVYFLNVS